MPSSRDDAEYLASFDSANFGVLWPEQAHVREEYTARFASRRDVAVELPTGGVKTPIALLVAGAWFEKGQRVAILIREQDAGRQMSAEATALGIPAARNRLAGARLGLRRAFRGGGDAVEGVVMKRTHGRCSETRRARAQGAWES